MTEIFTALALFLVIEGLLPFINPDAYKSAVRQLVQLPSQSLRFTGLGSMLLGAVLLYFVR